MFKFSVFKYRGFITMKYNLRRRLGNNYVMKLLFLTLICGLFILLAVQIRSTQFYLNFEPYNELLQNENFDLSEDELILDIQRRMPNLPMDFWNQNRKKLLGFNASCAQFPDIFQLEFNNNYWQTLRTTNGTCQLFGAYLDVRKTNIFGPTVRILAMLDRIEPTNITHCQFWFENKKQPVIVKTFWHNAWRKYIRGTYQPYLIECKIPSEYDNENPPVAVSLVENPCDNPNNILRVIFNKAEQKKDFAVCVKGLDFPHSDKSVKLAEWIELLHILGADKVFLYELAVHPNVSKLLKHYEKEGKVHVTPLTLAGGQPNAPSLQHFFLHNQIIHKRQDELIPYNDCFYKHMYEYKYIALLDIDEVIMPVQGSSWKELMDVVVPKAENLKMIERGSFSVRNVYFLDDLLQKHGWFENIPKYMHMLQHVYRAKNFTPPLHYEKSFFNTEKVLILHNHYPIACLGDCNSYSIDTKDAQLQHYRRDCVSELKIVCKSFRKNTIMDTTIWKFKKPLIERVTSTLEVLGYISKKTQFLDERYLDEKYD